MTSDKEEIYQWNTKVESNPYLDCFKRKCLSVLPFVHQNEASLRSIKVINKNYTCIQNQSLNHATRTITNLLIFATRDFGFDNTPYVPLHIRQYMIK